MRDQETRICMSAIGLLAIAVWTFICPEHLTEGLRTIVSYNTANMFIVSITLWASCGLVVGIFTGPPLCYKSVSDIPFCWTLTMSIIALIIAFGLKPFQWANLMPLVATVILMIPAFKLTFYRKTETQECNE